MNNKISLRIKAKEIRKNLNVEKISSECLNILKKNQIYLKSENIMIFYPTKFEINLLNLLNDNTKKFFLPRVKELYLEVCPYDKSTQFKKSKFNIFEPTSQSVNPEILDLVIVPALMADKQGYRLGYGKGFYDRFINTYKNNFKTITIIPKELLVDKLPIDKFDEKTDEVIVI